MYTDRLQHFAAGGFCYSSLCYSDNFVQIT